MLMIYKIRVGGQLEYDSTVYDAAFDVNKRKLDSIQNITLRIIMDTGRDTSAEAAKVALGIPPLVLDESSIYTTTG